MRQTAALSSIVLAVVALIGIGIYWEISGWQECRQTNSWSYCVRVLGK